MAMQATIHHKAKEQASIKGEARSTSQVADFQNDKRRASRLIQLDSNA